MNELHYRYWLGILIALIVGILTVNWANIKNLAELLSFGLALSSLVLAVIAIFQSLFSQTSFSQIAAKITTSAEDVRRATSQIEAASSNNLSQTRSIPGAFHSEGDKDEKVGG